MANGRQPWPDFKVIQGEAKEVDQQFVNQWIERFRKLMREEFPEVRPLSAKALDRIELQMIQLYQGINLVYADVAENGVNEETKVFSELATGDIKFCAKGFRAIIQELYRKSDAFAEEFDEEDPDYIDALDTLDRVTQEFIVNTFFDDTLELLHKVRALGFTIDADEFAAISPVVLESAKTVISAIDLFIYTRHGGRLPGEVTGAKGKENLVSLLRSAQELNRKAKAMPDDFHCVDDALAEFELDADDDFELEAMPSAASTGHPSGYLPLHNIPLSRSARIANMPVQASSADTSRSEAVEPPIRGHLSIVREP